VFVKQALYILSHTSSPFCSGDFGDGFSQTVLLGWPRTTILLISASQVARITGRVDGFPDDLGKKSKD
jgi:hypothetical protein